MNITLRWRELGVELDIHEEKIFFYFCPLPGFMIEITLVRGAESHGA